MKDIVLKYIEKDPISYIHIQELLDRHYEILYASNHGFIIKDSDIGFLYVSFDDDNVMKEVLPNHSLPHYFSYDERVMDYYNDRGNTINLYQYVYDSKEKFDVSAYDIRPLTMDQLSIVKNNYKAIGPDNIEDNVKNGELLGIYEEGVLAGFMGRHPEGCIGQFLIFPEFRRKGYGEALEKAIINKMIDEKQRVFGEVLTSNAISNHLQEKIGLKRGNKTIYWKIDASW